MLPELPAKRIIRRRPVVQMRRVQLPMRLQVPDLLRKERLQELLPLQIIAATCSHKLRQNALPGLQSLLLIAGLPEQPLQIEQPLAELPQLTGRVPEPQRSLPQDSRECTRSLLVRQQPGLVLNGTARGLLLRHLLLQEETIQLLPEQVHLRERVRLPELRRRAEPAARREQVVLHGPVPLRVALHGHPALVDRKINN